MQNRILFSSESVGKGHPDKICDQISDAILDAYLTLDPHSRVAIESVVSANLVAIAGEVSSKGHVDVVDVAKKVISEAGQYTENMTFVTDIKVQSEDIARGVLLDEKNIGAGDQGIMFGYATNETKEYMPLAIQLAHEIVKLATKKMELGEFKYAKSDMKSQVTIDYSDSKNPVIDTVLFSCQHDENFIEKEFKEFIEKNIVTDVLVKYSFTKANRILINPTGRFVIGGPTGDTGLTGRKIIVDTYGGASRHGGGAFSGKDSTKVDRSAAYMCRYIAKNLVAAGLADRIELQVSYAIGIAEPTSIMVETFNTEKVPTDKIREIIQKLFDLRPYAIINKLELKKPIYRQTATFGHFGRDDLSLPWEKLDMVEKIKKEVNN
ncbi:methionine adenosyltransferase [Mycoplasmopsis opalescens]|uniref:methionine adenosyltransferase n=1 Tax=Mycoplasmopsis opalescens TaxID=114886 RepID=UPI0004A6F82A|nr:methionine adenosyltransferase [Mycoplasmopsis opalescens]